jgi:hypothetical protein
MINKLERYGQLTYRGAWLLEVVAASIGLATAAALTFSGLDDGKLSILSGFLLGAPFIMVAFAELTKIPIATLLFAAKWYYKPIVATILLFLAFITWETVFSGLERSIALRQAEIQSLELAKRTIESNIENLQSGPDLVDQDAQIEQIDAEIETTINQRDQELDSLERQIDDLRSQLLPFQTRQKLEAVKAQINTLSSEITLNQETIENLEARDQELFQNQRESFENRIKIYLEQGAKSDAKRVQDQLRALPNPRNRSEWKQRREDYERNLEKNNQRLAELRGQEAELISSAIQDPNVQLRIDETLKQLEKVKTDFLTIISELRKRKDVLRDQVLRENQQRRDAEGEIISLRERLLELETEISKSIADNQIRRLAAFVYDKSIENVGSKEESLVGVYWAFSISLMAALAGPVTAIVALALQSIADAEQRKLQDLHEQSVRISYGQKLAKLLRKIMLSWRFRRVKTVKIVEEKIIEKEVEVIVEKEVEIPTGKDRLELVYVPVFTDSMEDVKKFIAEQDFPDEVSAKIQSGKT